MDTLKVIALFFENIDCIFKFSIVNSFLQTTIGSGKIFLKVYLSCSLYYRHNFCKKLQDFNGIIVIHCETIQSMFHMFKYTISYKHQV